MKRSMDRQAAKKTTGTSVEHGNADEVRAGEQRAHTDGRVSRSTWLALAAGTAAALGLAEFPLTAFFADFFRTFVHEFGHTAACWFFAHPAAPSFDPATGGGMTVYDDRNNWLLAAYALLFLLVMFLYRRNRLSMALLLSAAVAYAALVATSAHEVVILFLGHGAELIVAGALLYRVLGDESIRGKLRQPLYASLGIFILLQVATFSYQLLSSQTYRHSYEQTRGAGFEMDFTRLANGYLGLEVGYIAVLFLAASFLVPLACLGCFCCQRRLAPVQDRIRRRSGSDTAAGSPGYEG